MALKNRSFKTYTFEFLSIFIAVISAFALNNWNDIRRANKAEVKILTEISHGLEKDLEDIKLNVKGHDLGVTACNFWREIFRGKTPNLDTVRSYYFVMTRDFISIQNTSGYETLKSRGLELIKNDSLRTKIIELYEYDYETLLKLEEKYNEQQFHKNYFHKLNGVIGPNLKYDKKGDIVGMDLPLTVSEGERNLLLSYLWQIQTNRRFVLMSYTEIEKKIIQLSKEINVELNK